MNTITNFISSEISPKPNAAFKERALEKTLRAYRKSSGWNWKTSVKILTGFSIALALSIFIFVGVVKHGTTTKDKEMAQIDSDTQSLENEISQDPVLAEAVQLPN